MLPESAIGQGTSFGEVCITTPIIRTPVQTAGMSAIRTKRQWLVMLGAHDPYPARYQQTNYPLIVSTVTPAQGHISAILSLFTLREVPSFSFIR